MDNEQKEQIVIEMLIDAVNDFAITQKWHGFIWEMRTKGRGPTREVSMRAAVIMDKHDLPITIGGESAMEFTRNLFCLSGGQ